MSGSKTLTFLLNNYHLKILLILLTKKKKNTLENLGAYSKSADILKIVCK